MNFLLLLPLLCVVAADDNSVSTAKQEELLSTMIVNQLLLSQQTEVLKELLKASTQQTQCLTCPQPYTKILDECFFLSHHKLTWAKARQHCQGMSGDLATPKHILALKSFVQEKKGNDYVFVGARGSVGSKNGQGSRPFKWIDGRLVASSDWYPGEPNNLTHDEFCVSLRITYHPVLIDISCSEELQFACQYYHPQ
nr:C-type lectin domain family 4 member G-like [Cherax quadricarinatus]